MSEELKKETYINETNMKHSTLQKFTNVLEKFTVKLNYILHKISSMLLVLLMFLTAADVVGRYFFNMPITGTYELTGLFLAIMIFYSLGTGQIFKDHIEIDFFTKKMPMKAQNMIRCISSFVLFILVGLTSWQLFAYARRLYVGAETTGDLSIPLYIFPALIIFGSIAFALTLFLDSLKSLLKVVPSDES